MEDPSKRRVHWTPLLAATAGVLMSLGDTRTLRGRCEEALECLGSEQPGLPESYNGLAKALLRQADTVLPTLKKHLRQRAAGALLTIKKTCGWTLLAVDGSKIDLPRTVSHEDYFSIADNGKCPQAIVTAVVEVHTKLLWDWRIGKATTSEKQHLVEMTRDLPARSLLLADGNFVGYPIWQGLAVCGREFLIRVGGNVHLLSKLWPQAQIEQQGDIVYAWPRAMQHKGPPLVLRLIKIGRGKKRIHLLTNVLNQKRLTDKAAGKIYRLRWGSEVFYRTFKKTLDHVKLKSRTGVRGQVELEWALVGCWIMTLLAIDAMAQQKVDPKRLSHAEVLHQLQKNLRRRQPGEDSQRLRCRLAMCVRDNYQRQGSKASRHCPRTKNTPKHHTLKPPKVRRATAEERRIAHQDHSAIAA